MRWSPPGPPPSSPGIKNVWVYVFVFACRPTYFIFKSKFEFQLYFCVFIYWNFVIIAIRPHRCSPETASDREPTLGSTISGISSVPEETDPLFSKLWPNHDTLDTTPLHNTESKRLRLDCGLYKCHKLSSY